MKVIATTLVYNTPDLADAMRAQLPEIVVVDNGSTPPIAGAQVWIPENRMFSGGWNAAMDALAMQGAEYVWQLNSDVQGVSPDMLADLAQTAQRHALAVVTPAFNSPHGLFHSRGVGWRQVPWVDWTCPLVSLEAWRRVGGFDAQLVGYFADVDWCARARALGYALGVADWLVVQHLGSVTALRTGHVWDADDSYLVRKWGKRWTEMV